MTNTIDFEKKREKCLLAEFNVLLNEVLIQDLKRRGEGLLASEVAVELPVDKMLDLLKFAVLGLLLTGQGS